METKSLISWRLVDSERGKFRKDNEMEKGMLKLFLFSPLYVHFIFSFFVFCLSSVFYFAGNRKYLFHGSPFALLLSPLSFVVGTPKAPVLWRVSLFFDGILRFTSNGAKRSDTSFTFLPLYYPFLSISFLLFLELQSHIFRELSLFSLG